MSYLALVMHNVLVLSFSSVVVLENFCVVAHVEVCLESIVTPEGFDVVVEVVDFKQPTLNPGHARCVVATVDKNILWYCRKFK